MITQIEAAELLSEKGIKATVVNARFAKPLDMELISELANKTGRILTVEENVIAGGFGSAILEELTQSGAEGFKLRMLGLPDRFIEQGPQALLRKGLGLDAEGIAKEAQALIK